MIIDGQQVELISYTPEPDILCAAAAKLCHEPDDKSFIEMMAWLREHPDHVKRIIKFVIDNGHTSTIEHAVFNFYIGGVSRALTHQLVRHRIASYSQQSQRHVDMSDFSYVVPPQIGKDTQLRSGFRETMDKLRGGYDALVKLGIKPEDARFLLPNACTTKIVVSMNARALHNFFNLRLSKHAQWEIRQVAHMMLHEVKMVAPVIFNKFEL